MTPEHDRSLAAGANLIRTLRGVGYMLVTPGPKGQEP